MSQLRKSIEDFANALEINKRREYFTKKNPVKLTSRQYTQFEEILFGKRVIKDNKLEDSRIQLPKNKNYIRVFYNIDKEETIPLIEIERKYGKDDDSYVFSINPRVYLSEKRSEITNDILNLGKRIQNGNI